MATKRFDRWRLRFAAIAMMSACAGWATAATDLPAGVSRGPAPAWIDPVDVAAIAPAAASDGVAYVLVDDQVSILGDEPVEYRRLVYDVVDREGLEDAGRTPIGFQPDYQRIALHGLIVERAGARGDRSADVRAELLRRETNADAGMLDGQRTLELFLPDVRVGDRLDISYSVIGRNPVFGDDFHAARNMGYGQGIGMRRIVAFAPASRALFARANGVGYVRDERIDGALQIGEIDHPSELRIERTAHRHLATKRMPVHAAALVPHGDIRQPVGSFEAKVFHELDDVRHEAEFTARTGPEPCNRDRLAAPW